LASAFELRTVLYGFVYEGYVLLCLDSLCSSVCGMFILQCLCVAGVSVRAGRVSVYRRVPKIAKNCCWFRHFHSASNISAATVQIFILNLINEYFSRICGENPNYIKIWQV
jgi:hypothetical protein